MPQDLLNEFVSWFSPPVLSFLGGAMGAIIWHWFAKERFRFETIHAERLRAMKEIYAQMADLIQLAREYVYMYQNDEGYLRVHESSKRLFELLIHNRIIFNESIAKKIDVFMDSIRNPVYELHIVYTRNGDDAVARESRLSALKKLLEDLKIDGLIDELKHEIESEFQKSLWIN